FRARAPGAPARRVPGTLSADTPRPVRERRGRGPGEVGLRRRAADLPPALRGARVAPPLPRAPRVLRLARVPARPRHAQAPARPLRAPARLVLGVSDARPLGLPSPRQRDDHG